MRGGYGLGMPARWSKLSLLGLYGLVWWVGRGDQMPSFVIVFITKSKGNIIVFIIGGGDPARYVKKQTAK